MKLPRASAIFLLVVSSILAGATPTRAETGYEGWLRYATIDDASLRKSYEKTLPAVVVAPGNSEAEQWRDAVCQWFFKMSDIPDQYGRVDHDPNRIEAEAMKLDGYEVFDVKPWETASGGKAIRVVSADNHGSASFNYSGKPGWYNLAVQYYDQTNGVSQFTLLIAGQKVDQWLADDMLPSRNVQSLPNGHTSTRHTAHGVALRTGDEIKIEAVADGGERACVDYLEIEPAKP